MAFSAFSWLSGVTPAQHVASTQIGTSGRYALIRSALEITQMSVQSPTSVMLSISPVYSDLPMYISVYHKISPLCTENRRDQL